MSLLFYQMFAVAVAPHHVPKWTNEPVKPGEQGKITVKYDSNRIGSFSKQITSSSMPIMEMWFY